MKTLVVDTNVVSYLFKQDTRATLYEPHLLNTLPAISFMTLAELERWALRSNWGQLKRQQLTQFLNPYVVLVPDNALCRVWAEVIEQVRRSGNKIDSSDAWIAATALHYRVPLVTHNRKDYAFVNGLNLISEAPQ